MRSSKTSSLAVAALLVAGCGSSSAATLYVHAGGACSDSRERADVSLDSPLCTLGKAAELVEDGGTIVVRSGRYPRLTIARAYGEKVTIKPQPGERPLLRGALFTETARNVRLERLRITDVTQVEGRRIELVGNDMSPHGVVLNGSNNVAERNRIHDLRIVFDPQSKAPRCHGFWRTRKYPLSQTGGIAPWCGTAFRTKGAGHVIRRNVVKKVPADGVQATETRNLLIEGNRFEDIAIQSAADGGDPLEHPDGVQLIGRNENTVIRRNAFIDTRGVLPMMGEGNRWPTNLRVENNVFHTVTKASSGAICIQATAVTRMMFVNNTCWGTGAFGPAIRISDGTPDTARISDTSGIVVRNNIAERFVTDGVEIEEDYNLVGSYEMPPGQRRGSHSIVGQPRFVRGDVFLRLAPGSPGIDAGTSQGAPRRDRQGERRCGAPDIGADELTAPCS